MSLLDAARNAAGKLNGRWHGLAAAAVVFAALVIFGKLTAAAALVSLAALLVWAALWPLSATAFSVDAHDARRRLDAATRSASAWRAIVESLPDPALALNNAGAVLSASRAAIEVLPGAQPGRHISQVTRAPELLTAIDNAGASGDVQSCRLDFKVPVERSLAGTVASLKIAGSDDDLPQILVVLRDLTEQDRLVRMRADFVANASHELRTPLASLKGFVETLQGAAKDDPIARERFLKIMQMQAERMARLIEDLLSLSRIEMRAHVPPRDKVDLRAIIAHVAQTLGPIAKEKDIALEIASLPPTIVLGDRDELIQVFQNLIENAIKYGRKGGRVSIANQIVRNPGRGEQIAVAITDDGPGIAPEHLPRLTERFYRVNAAHSRNTGGTGLGLAIVKHVLNRHHAELHIESAPGKGSTFRVVLALLPAEKPN